MESIIIHIDLDSFFASVEQEYNLAFRNKPLGVTATNGRTCIIASSREAKLLGIKTGTRSWEAKRLCPKIIFTPADFVKYWEISKKFLNICKDYSPYVELFSIDEVFIDITKTIHLFGNVDKVVLEIKKRVRKELGECITVSVGISHNKLLSKLASGIKKPDGFFKITKEDIDGVYSSCRLTDICGIGDAMAKRLSKLGIYNLLTIRKVPDEILVKEFGNSYTIFLKKVAYGLDDSEVVPYTFLPEIKSISRDYCLPKNEYSKKVIMDNIYELSEEIGIKLRRLSKKAKTISLSLRGEENISFQKTYALYFDRGTVIFNLLESLLSSNINFTKTSFVRQISVSVSSLEDNINLPQSFFDIKYQRVQETIDLINDRFGDHTIRNGTLLYADKLTTVPNGYLADKYERVKLAR
jgi:DNA polymerase-4